jgi:hypothetical protein
MAGHHSADHPHPDPDWCPAGMADTSGWGYYPSGGAGLILV